MSDYQSFTNAILATIPDENGYGLVNDAMIVTKGEEIVFAGNKSDLPPTLSTGRTIDVKGKLITPGLIDCHTHLIYGGSRAKEFELRQQGASYEEIAKSGGGIISTVTATRAASDAELLNSALFRLDQLIASGATTVEIKSGYGLDCETELKMLRIASELSNQRPINILKTFLGAHAVPKGMDADTYIDTICLPTLIAAAEEGLVDAVDGFCENIAFTPAQIERVFQTAKDLNIPVKLHAEQLSDQKGASLAAQYHALSADHLEFISDTGIKDMAKAGTIAVLLPGAYYFLKETKKPPVDHLRTHGVPIAVATDCNPGSSPMTSLLLTMNMAAIQFGLTPEECMRGVTKNAATALGQNTIGQLKAGFRADFIVWDTDHPAELTYRMGNTPIVHRIFGGTIC
jgi:imidazolonepropionase